MWAPLLFSLHDIDHCVVNLFQRETAKEYNKRDEKDGNNVTERFEVTITKMNTEDEDEGMFKTML